MRVACFCGEVYEAWGNPEAGTWNCPRCGSSPAPGTKSIDTSGNYFQTPEQAHDWLPFDSGEFECEIASWTENDRYAEWLIWRREHAGAFLDSGGESR